MPPTNYITSLRHLLVVAILLGVAIVSVRISGPAASLISTYRDAYRVHVSLMTTHKSFPQSPKPKVRFVVVNPKVCRLP